MFAPASHARTLFGLISSLGKQDMIDKQHTIHDVSAAQYSPSQPSPMGCRWHSNSCAYNATLFVIYNMWNMQPVEFSATSNDMCNDWLLLMAKSSQSFNNGVYLLEEVREFIRRKLHREVLGMFIYGQTKLLWSCHDLLDQKPWDFLDYICILQRKSWPRALHAALLHNRAHICLPYPTRHPAASDLQGLAWSPKPSRAELGQALKSQALGEGFMKAWAQASFFQSLSLRLEPRLFKSQIPCFSCRYVRKRVGCLSLINTPDLPMLLCILYHCNMRWHHYHDTLKAKLFM